MQRLSNSSRKSLLSKLNWNSLKAWWFDPTTKRLGYAVLVSAFVHLLFIEQSDWVGFSNMAMPFRSIDAELVPANVEAVNPIIANEKQDSVVLKNSTQAVAMPDLPAQPTTVEAPLPAETVSGPDEASVDEHTDAVAAQEVVANAPTDVDAEQALVLPDTTEEPEKSQPFTMVETDFDVLMNHNLERVGTAKIHYAKGNDQTYELTWKVSATGIVGLLYPDLLQNSQGKITEAGLLPSYYLYKFGAREDKSYQASFNWVDKEIALQSTKGTKTVPIASDAAAGHTQDF